MSQPYGKTGSTSGWSRNFLRSLTSFDFSQLNVYAGIRAGVLITSLLIIGVLSNHIRKATLAVLGTIFFDHSYSHAHSRFRNQCICIYNRLYNREYLSCSTSLAIGLFIISYFGVYPNTAIIVMISAVVFSVGVALPGINNIPPGERFWLFLVGGLWGVVGAIASLGWQLLKKNPAAEDEGIRPPD